MLGYKVIEMIKRSDCRGVLIAVKECHNQNEVFNDKCSTMGRGKLEEPKQNVYWWLLLLTRPLWQWTCQIRNEQHEGYK